MPYELKVFRGYRFLGSRGVAHEVRIAAEDFLCRDPSAIVLLDFSGVEGISHSFADELLSPLNDLLHEAVRDRVWLTNCSDKVLEELNLSALMHGLFMPSAVRRLQEDEP